MQENVENTRAEGSFGKETAKHAPKMPEKPMDTRAEGVPGRGDNMVSEKERKCEEEVAKFLGYLMDFWNEEDHPDERVELMLELAEAIARNLKGIQRARLDEMEGRREGKWQETLKILSQEGL